MADIIERFLAKVTKTDDCWLWTGMIVPTGYGRIRYDGQPRTAHSVSYMLFVGEIAPGYEIDHLCKNRRCVNPDHLEQVTHAENMFRARRSHCKRGHDMSIHGRVMSDNSLRCNRCKLDRENERYARSKEVG